MGAAGCGSWELPHRDLRPPAWGKACGRSPVGAAGSCARGRGARGQCQWAGLFSTICLARPEAAAGQGRWKQLLRLCCYLWHREEKWGKKGQKAAGWTPPFAASCSPLRPAPNPIWALWGAPGLGGHEQRGGQGLPPRRSWGLTRGDVSGLREVHAGCPAQPHIPEGWKAAWGQGLGWGLQPKSSCCFLPGVGPSTPELNPQTPIPRVPHPPALGTRSDLVPTPAPNTLRAGWGRPGPHPSRVLWSILGHQNNPPAPPSFQMVLSLVGQPRVITRPRLPTGTLWSLILVIVSRNHWHAAPRDPRQLRSEVPRVGSPTGTPLWIWDGEHRRVFRDTPALGSKQPFFWPSQPLGTGDAPS